MARKKNIDTEVVEPEEVPAIKSGETSVTEIDDAISEPEEAPAEIPANVLSILEAFNGYNELWVSPFGGVYTSKPTTVKGAILYKNPFYKP